MLTIFCWLNTIAGLYFVVESFREFESTAAYIFLGWAVMFFLFWLFLFFRKTMKRSAGGVLNNQR